MRKPLKKQWRAWRAAVKPEVPDGFDDNYQLRQSVHDAWHSPWLASSDSTAGDPLMNNSLLETGIADA